MLDTQKDTLKNALIELSNSLTRIEGERSYIKETIEDISEKLEIDKKLLRKLSRLYHNQNYTEMEQEYEDLAELYEKVVPESK